MSLLKELNRRNVFKVTIAYVVMAWLVLQVADVILNNITAPGWIFKVLMLFLAIGLPFAVFFAWAFELTPEGLKREHEVDRGRTTLMMETYSRSPVRGNTERIAALAKSYPFGLTFNSDQELKMSADLRGNCV